MNAMNEFIKLSYGEAPYDIHIEAWRVGVDILAKVTGGTRPHIGAVALAEPTAARHPVTGETHTTPAEQGAAPGLPPEATAVDNTEEPTPCLEETPAAAQAPSPCIVSVLTARGHKDAVIAEMFAKWLCEKYGVKACVSAGVHVDCATKEEIALLVENSKILLKML